MARDSFLSCNIKFIDHPDAQDLRIVDDLTWMKIPSYSHWETLQIYFRRQHLVMLTLKKTYSSKNFVVPQLYRFRRFFN